MLDRGGFTDYFRLKLLVERSPGRWVDEGAVPISAVCAAAGDGPLHHLRILIEDPTLGMKANAKKATIF